MIEKKQKEPTTLYLRETVFLDDEEVFIHIELDKDQLSKAFSMFAEKFGYEKGEAEDFFQREVSVSFYRGSKNQKELLKSVLDDKIDSIVSKLLQGVLSRKFLGIVIPRKSGLRLLLNPFEISKSLLKLEKTVFDLNGYEELTKEQKIQAFKQTLNSITFHEFFHLLQFMENRKNMVQSSKRINVQNKVILTFTLLAPLISQIKVLESLQSSALALIGLSVAGFSVFMSRGMTKIENDAYSAQDMAKSIDLVSPYKFSIEE